MNATAKMAAVVVAFAGVVFAAAHTLPHETAATPTPPDALNPSGSPKPSAAASATAAHAVNTDADGVVHIDTEAFIGEHPRLRLLCTIAEKCTNIHITADPITDPKADKSIRGYTLVNIRSGLESTGNNADSDAEYAAEAKADPDGAKEPPYEGRAQYKTNNDGTYTVEHYVWQPYPSPGITLKSHAATQEDAVSIAVDYAIDGYISNACDANPTSKSYCNDTTVTAALPPASQQDQPALQKKAPAETGFPASESDFVNAYVRANMGQGGYSTDQLVQLARETYNMAKGVDRSMLRTEVDTLDPNAQRAMTYLGLQSLTQAGK